MPMGSFMSEVYELGLQVSPLKLTDAEIALFNAVLVLNPDRGDLHDKDRIEELQSTLLHVLYKHLKHYRSGKFQHLLSLSKPDSSNLDSLSLFQTSQTCSSSCSSSYQSFRRSIESIRRP